MSVRETLYDVNIRTRTHIEGTATRVVRADGLIGSQTGVANPRHRAIFADEDIIRFEVSMVDPFVMARLHGVQDLDEDALDESVVLAEGLALHDHAVQIATRAVVQHEEDEPVIFDNVVESENAGMVRHNLVCDDLAALALPHESSTVSLGKDFDSIFLWGGLGRRPSAAHLLVNSKIDDAVTTLAKNPDQLQTTSVYYLTNEARRVGSARLQSHGFQDDEVRYEGRVKQVRRKCRPSHLRAYNYALRGFVAVYTRPTRDTVSAEINIHPPPLWSLYAARRARLKCGLVEDEGHLRGCLECNVAIPL